MFLVEWADALSMLRPGVFSSPVRLALVAGPVRALDPVGQDTARLPAESDDCWSEISRRISMPWKDS